MTIPGASEWAIVYNRDPVSARAVTINVRKSRREIRAPITDLSGFPTDPDEHEERTISTCQGEDRGRVTLPLPDGGSSARDLDTRSSVASLCNSPDILPDLSIETA